MKRVVLLFISLVMIVGLIVPSSAASTDNLATKPVAQFNYGYDINFDSAEDGVVSIFFNNIQEKKMKLVVQLGTEKYIYNIFNNEEYVNYPLQLGDGTYKVSIYENTTGTKYKKISSKSKYVVAEDPNDVYLQSVLEINWEVEDESILLADELLAAALEVKKENVTIDKQESILLTETEIINELYLYVIKNIEYDYDKINGLDYSYVPTNDTTLELKTGICYDYSSLLASMLRSQGIPAKMAKGYANTSSVYHAWNEVYLSDEERWIVVDPTYDAYMVQNGYSYSFEKESDNYNKIKEF